MKTSLSHPKAERSLRGALTALAMTVTLFPAAANASTTLTALTDITNSSSIVYSSSNDWSFGIEFTLTDNITLTSVGINESVAQSDQFIIYCWDVTENHAVSLGVFDGGTYAGSGLGTSVNGYDYMAISNVSLTIGHTYIIYTNNSYSSAATINTTYATNENVTVGEGVTNIVGMEKSGTVVPTMQAAATTYTPTSLNFTYTVPEPSTYAMVASGVGALLLLRRRTVAS